MIRWRREAVAHFTKPSPFVFGTQPSWHRVTSIALPLAYAKTFSSVLSRRVVERLEKRRGYLYVGTVAFESGKAVVVIFLLDMVLNAGHVVGAGKLFTL